jgi:hypothetical protein
LLAQTSGCVKKLNSPSRIPAYDGLHRQGISRKGSDMSKEMDAKEMVQRILAVAEILSTVATPEEIRTANQGRAHKIIPLSIQVESRSNKQQKHQEVKR